ncbi:TPA: hypothetical protein QDB04_000512 [Burkholderia vietnamiensis]|nr:hypothetical protein [Burkholderia vietnamiensis]
MQPTAIGAAPRTLSGITTLEPAPVYPVAPVAQTSQGLTLPQNFPLSLNAEQTTALQARIEQFDFTAMPLQSFAMLSQEPTTNLNRVLDGFLSRINKAENPQLFKLVDALSEKIAEEKIGALAEQILDAKPTLRDQVIGFFSKKKLQESLDKALEELGRTVRAKSKTLSDLVIEQEKKLTTEMAKLQAELGNLANLKAEYRNAFIAFCIEVAFLNSVLSKAKAAAPALVAAAGKDVMLKQDIQDKLQALESVSLSREAMMTRLPGEALITRQLENAGVQTLLELATTMGDQFASIRMVLLNLHGANLVRNVQRLGQANANLDNQLQAARAKLMQTVVTTAANAAGDNRIEQANNLKRVVNDSETLQKTVNEAREANQRKFEEARNTMAQVRQDFLALASN